MIPGLGGRLAFGADYNPEQWPESVWAEDVRLMREAGVTMVTLGVFSWGLLEPSEGSYEFGWLDRVVELLHDGGIAIDMATATASPPAWFTRAYPHTRLVDDHGVTREFGARQNYCPSAPEYRRAASALATRMAERYGAHPGVALWHVGNEYGCHNWHCFCDVSAAAYREWLRGRYSSLDALNDAWGTAFWSQHYTEWEQIAPPRAVAYKTFANPTQQLDWWRFSSDELLACYRAEVEAIRPLVRAPVTTNFMNFFKPLDYWAWAEHVDLVSNDHYLLAADPENAQQLAMTADLMRSLAGGGPWLLMEHSTSAVNWQPRNLAKTPGQMRRNSLQHIARGSDGAMFFQWRASRAGAEKFHSGLVPHAGSDTKVWREVVQLGEHLAALSDVAGSRVDQAEVAILFDWNSWWAAELDSHPSVDVDVIAEARRWHDALWARNVLVDFVPPHGDLSAYKMIILPVQYLLEASTATLLRDYVGGGGTLIATYFSGIVDENDHIGLGGYPAGLRELLGVRVEEFFPLAAGAQVELSAYGPGRVWSELAHADDADVLATYADGPLAGSPAICRSTKRGAWYVGTQLHDAGLGTFLDQVLEASGVAAPYPQLPRGVEVVRRTGERANVLFVINHTDEAVQVPAAGIDLFTGNEAATHTVPAGAVAAIRER